MPLGSRPPNAPGAVPGCWRQDQKSTQTNGIFIWIPFFGGDLFGHAHPSSSTWAHANLLQWARGRRSAGRGCAVLVLEQWHPHSLSLSLSPSPLGSAAWRIRNESRTFGPQSVWTAVSLDRGRLDRSSVWAAVTYSRAVQTDRGPNVLDPFETQKSTLRSIDLSACSSQRGPKGSLVYTFFKVDH